MSKEKADNLSGKRETRLEEVQSERVEFGSRLKMSCLKSKDDESTIRKLFRARSHKNICRTTNNSLSPRIIINIIIIVISKESKRNRKISYSPPLYCLNAKLWQNGTWKFSSAKTRRHSHEYSEYCEANERLQMLRIP
jgi:hypothetical protein